MFKNLSLQEYLSLGYLFLVVLGVIIESVFYGLFGLPYLQYTSILDILISPISLLADNWILLIAFISFLLLFLYFFKKSPFIHEKNKHKKWYKKLYNVEKLDEKYNEQSNNPNSILLLMLYIIFAILIGFRVGMGGKYKNLLKNGSFKSNYTLTFKNDKQINVKKIGQNSLFIFYVEEGEKVVTATPILENIKQIKRIQKDE